MNIKQMLRDELADAKDDWKEADRENTPDTGIIPVVDTPIDTWTQPTSPSGDKH